ncbi:MAG: MATE family efflux transporter [Balneolaceae bacterium]|nr:MATE family efflux transporter [Balneolaceae bacterium]
MNRKILNLAIPNIVSNLSVPLLGVVDTALVGHLEEVYYLGAIAVGGMIFNFLFWGFGFLRMGTTGLTAQTFGEKDQQESVLILARALAVAAVFSTLIILLQGWIADLSFWLVEASPEVERYTEIYFNIRIYLGACHVGLVRNQRVVPGDAKRPLSDDRHYLSECTKYRARFPVCLRDGHACGRGSHRHADRTIRRLCPGGGVAGLEVPQLAQRLPARPLAGTR